MHSSNGDRSAEQGMILMATGVLLAPGVHTFAKTLGDSMASGQVTMARIALQMVFIAPLILVAKQSHFAAPTLSQMLRGVLLAAATCCFFTALVFMPMAESTSIFFLEPLLLTLISALFLGEKIGKYRIGAVLLGFIGAIIVIRPAFADLGWPVLLPLAAALFFAIYLAITRHRGAYETASVTQFWVACFGALFLALLLFIGEFMSVAAFTLSWPQPQHWLLFLAMGALATLCSQLAIRALQMAPAAILAPFQYLEILGATILGYIVFADIPDYATVIGSAIIVGAGLIVFHRERLHTKSSAM